MIDTIFYFIPSLTFEQYQNKLAGNEIAYRTVVFAEEQRAIYKGGVKYSGFTAQEFHDMLENEYDDSWIKTEIDGIKQDIIDAEGRIDGLDTLIRNLSGRLDDEIEELGDNVLDKVEEMFDDVEWLHNHFPLGVTSWDSGWNSNIEAYLLTVGYWDVDGQGNKTTKWSKLSASIDSLTASVNNLTTGGNMSTALLASIQALIDEKLNTAIARFDTMYAKVSDIEGVQKVIEWLYSGFTSQTNENTTFSEIYASGSNSVINAISSIRAQVDKLETGYYVAKNEMASQVSNAIAAILTQADPNNALVGLSAKVDKNSSDLASILLSMTGSESTADILTRMGLFVSGLATTTGLTNAINQAKAEIYAAYGTENGEPINIAGVKSRVTELEAVVDVIAGTQGSSSGLVSKAELGSAVAELFALTGNAASPAAKASVMAYIKDDLSSVKLTANHVDIDGYLRGGSALFTGNVTATSFSTGTVNEYGISAITGDFETWKQQNPSVVNQKKAYFAYDSEQGCVTMWIYRNGAWACINMDESSVISNNSNYFEPVNFYNLSENDTYLKDESVLDGQGRIETYYYCPATDKYYSQMDTRYPLNPAGGVAADEQNVGLRYIIERDSIKSSTVVNGEKQIVYGLPDHYKSGNRAFNNVVLASIPDSIYRRDSSYEIIQPVEDVSRNSSVAGIGAEVKEGAASECVHAATIKKCQFKNGRLVIVAQCDAYYMVSKFTEVENNGTTSITKAEVQPLFVKRAYTTAEPYAITLGGLYFDIPYDPQNQPQFLDVVAGNAFTAFTCSYVGAHNLGEALWSNTDYGWSEKGQNISYSNVNHFVGNGNPPSSNYTLPVTYND